jgi:hypothetical protein
VSRTPKPSQKDDSSPRLFSTRVVVAVLLIVAVTLLVGIGANVAAGRYTDALFQAGIGLVLGFLYLKPNPFGFEDRGLRYLVNAVMASILSTVVILLWLLLRVALSR